MIVHLTMINIYQRATELILKQPESTVNVKEDLHISGPSLLPRTTLEPEIKPSDTLGGL